MVFDGPPAGIAGAHTLTADYLAGRRQVDAALGNRRAVTKSQASGRQPATSNVGA